LGLHNNIFPLMIKYRLSNHKLFWERNNEI
jgi:hypothetical protein